MNHNLKQINSQNAPKAIGPYSQAVQVKNLVFVSGQLPLDPKTLTLVENNIETQTTQVIDNIEAILQEANLTLSDVVKCEVFLKDMKDFTAMNAIYEKRFRYAIKPARQAFQVAMLPLNALVEISCIAAKE